MSTTSDTASAASPAVAYAFVIGLTAASWYGLWRYARPAIQSQAGRPTRMTRDRRLRTIAFSVLVMIYPLMFTAGCVMMAFQPTGDAGIWTANLMVWAMAAALITAPLLGLLALVFRTIDRHRARVHRRSLGLPDPPAPWWPSAVAATWSVIVVGGSIAVGYLAWQLFSAYAERRSELFQSQWQVAMNDPSVQQLVARGASRATIEDRLITLTGTGGDVADLKNHVQVFMVGNIVAVFVVVAVVIGGAVLLYRRQKRRVAHYEARIADSASRAAQLAI